MENQSSARAAVVLAAGKGTRMKSELPKVAVPLRGEAMLLHVLKSLKESGIHKVVLVVGYKRDVVMSLVSEITDMDIGFAIQEEQKGTAHALLCAREALNGFTGDILVACGDMPLIRAETFHGLMKDHLKENRDVTVLSSVLENPAGYGRIIRDDRGQLAAIIEEKDADEATRQIQETNTGTYVFRSPEIFEILQMIDSNNAQSEFYLPDAIRIFRERGGNVGARKLQDPVEALGANSREDLEFLERIYAER